MVVTAVEQYRSAGDAAARIDLDVLADAELDEELVGLLEARNRLDAEVSRRIACWDARNVWSGDGSRSAAGRLGRDGHLSRSTAQAMVARARAVAVMPATARSWAAGDISADQIDLLARVRGAGREELFTRDEALLVEHCSSLSHVQASKAVRYWRQRADAELGHDGTPPDPAVSLKLSTGFEGTVMGEFALDPIGGAVVTEALARIERELYLADHEAGVESSKAERLARALVEMAIRAQTAPRQGHRPEPLVTILAGESSIENILELSTGTVIDAGCVVPYLCRAQVQTFIFDGADRVLAASKQRTFRGTLRRAIQVRDRHCQHPSGCDAAIAECDVNHRKAWAEGGTTSEDNGDIQCHPHNRESDLHGRAPAEVIEEARWRRESEYWIRKRVDDLIALRETQDAA